MYFQSDSVMHSPPQRNHTQLSQPRSASPALIGDTCLSTDTVTTMMVPASGRPFDQPNEVNVPEFPRHKLRLLEKLGEGGFGMVSQLV